jgi:cytochrome P450
MPDCQDWTLVNIHRKLLRVVAMASGRVFVGPELCRSEAYLDAAVNYTVELMAAQRAVTALPHWQLPFLANGLPEVKALNRRLVQAESLFGPVIAARQALPPDQRPRDMLSWVMEEQARRSGDSSTRYLTKLQLRITFAATHTTVATATNA